MKRIISFIKNIIFSIIKYLINFLYLLPAKKLKKEFDNKINVPDKSTRIISEIAEVYNNKKAILTIISDDGDYQTGINLKRLTDKYGIPISVAGTVNKIALHKKFWINAVKPNMFECINHSYNHKKMAEGTSISENYSKLFHEIIHSKRYYERIFRTKSISFVCPENYMCSLGYKIISENSIYAVARGNMPRDFNSLSPEKGILPGQWYNLNRVGINDNADVAKRDRKQWVDDVIREKKWLIEMWHNVKSEDDGAFQTIIIEEAEEHLDYVAKQNELWVALFSDAVKYIYEKQNSIITSYLYNGFLYVFVELINLPIDTFDQELTVLIDCSSPSFDDSSLNFHCYSGKRTLLLNVIPNHLYQIEIKNGD